MDANEYQQQALRTWHNNPVDECHAKIADLYLSGKLCSESGEVNQLIAKNVMHGKAFTTEQLRSELGDVVWYVSAIAKEYGLTLAEILQANIEKLRERHPNGDTRAFYQGE